MDATTAVPQVVTDDAAMAGTDVATYTRERPGMSAFVIEDGVVHHTYSAYARGLDGLWGMYQWLDRAPKGRKRDGPLVAPPRRIRQSRVKRLLRLNARPVYDGPTGCSSECLTRQRNCRKGIACNGAQNEAKLSRPVLRPPSPTHP